MESHDRVGLEPAALELTGYLGRVSRRVLWFKVARGSAFALGLGLLLLVVCSLSVGPSVGVLGAVLTWSSVVAGVLLAAAVGVGRLDELSGARKALLLSGYDRRLAERARSAAELAGKPNGSPELVEALTRSVVQELSVLPVERVVARPRHWGRMSSVSSVLALASLALLVTSEKAASGLFALTHPARDDASTPVGLWISSFEVTITYPENRGGGVQTLISPREIHVPEGSELALNLRPRFEVDRTVLSMHDRTLPLVKDDDGHYRLALTAEKSGPLGFRAHVGEQWVNDPIARSLVVDQDKPPEVTLEAPLVDTQVSPDEPVPFVFKVQDDHSLEGIDLVVQLGPGRERRRRIQAFAMEPAEKAFHGGTELTPRDFGANGGETLVVWIEARDRDGFGGPNVGRSAVRTLTVGEREDENGTAPIEQLERTRDLAVDTLGARLEDAMPSRASDAEERAQKLAKASRTLVRQLDSLASAYASGTGDSATAGVIRDMTQRISRLLREESSARDLRGYKDKDEALVAELEDDVLWLSDLIGKAKLGNAEKVLERLSATRARMKELLEQLKRTNDPARKAELMAEIARARSELAELGKKLAQAQRDVPSDFVNYEALAEQAAKDPLSDLEKALESGDMAAAEKALAQLDEELAGLENGVTSGGEAFADARFSPRNEAAQRAQSEVRELSKAQKQLANETGRVADAARARGSQDKEFKSEADKLSKQAEALEKRARGLEAGRMQSAVAEAQASAAQRLRDARDALKQGDADEAKQMAERAADDLGALSSEMSLDARMFPGADGSRNDAAKKAGQLARDAQAFAEDVKKLAPQEPDQLSQREAQDLEGQAPQQRSLGEAAQKAARELKDKAPPSVGEGLERVQQAMQKAADALQEGDVREAEAHQRDALDQLGELNEELARSQKAGKKSGQREGDGEGDSMSAERVTIPNADDPRRNDLRRRVLDARRARSPAPYSRAIDRYYQEILR